MRTVTSRGKKLDSDNVAPAYHSAAHRGIKASCDLGIIYRLSLAHPSKEVFDIPFHTCEGIFVHLLQLLNNLLAVELEAAAFVAEEAGLMGEQLFVVVRKPVET